MHLDSAFESLPAEAAEARREGQRQLLYKIAGLAEETGAKAILLAGDVFDSDAVSQKTQEAFQKAFGSIGIPVFVAPGNHDPYTPSSVWARVALPENVHVFKTEVFECVELDGIRIWGAGFESIFASGLLGGFSAPSEPDGYDVMVLHGDLCSGISDYNAVSRSQIAKSGMDYIALGHIHSRTTIQTEGKTAFAYCGWPPRPRYDELGKMGVYLVALTDSGVSANLSHLASEI
jgi:DNA repair exonuclease SbcCD nuclease subunit